MELLQAHLAPRVWQASVHPAALLWGSFACEDRPLSNAVQIEWPCYCREVRGPVLDITVLDGVILAAAGTRLEVLELRGTALQRTAFLDAQILLRSVAVIKDYILLGDVHKSLTFVQSSQRCRQLNELSKACFLKMCAA